MTPTALLPLTPLDLPLTAALSLQYRIRHPRRGHTIEYWTINARNTEPSGRTTTCGDFGRWYVTLGDSESFQRQKAAAQAALEEARLDLRTRRWTAFNGFADLVAAPYTPTLRFDPKLADAYDAAQASIGSAKRASRF